MKLCLEPQMLQDTAHGIHIGEPGALGDQRYAVREQGSGDKRQNRVLGTADMYFSQKAATAFDTDRFQNYSPMIGFS